MSGEERCPVTTREHVFPEGSMCLCGVRKETVSEVAQLRDALAAATRLAESRAAEIAELRSRVKALLDETKTRYDFDIGDFSALGILDLSAFLNRPADARGAEVLAAAERMYDELQEAAFGWDLGLPERVQANARKAMECWRALVGGQGAGEAG
jgi:hypothetical protein